MKPGDAPGSAQGLSYVPYLTAELEAPDLHARFPSAELLAAAAGLYVEDAAPRRAGYPRHRLIVGAGAVQLMAHGYQTRADPRSSEARGQVLGWSARSRTRMVRTMSVLDYGPLFAAGAPAMVTLTLPGDWRTVAPTGAAFKVLMHRWFKRFEWAWGVELVVVWKLEFQGRGAPHLHLLLAPITAWPSIENRPARLSRRAGKPPSPEPTGASDRIASAVRPPSDPGQVGEPVRRVGRPAVTRATTGPATARCKCRICGSAGVELVFRDWLSHSWAAVVAHPDPEEYGRHLRAGTGIDWPAGMRMTDPHRVAAYFAKHGGAGGGKEYQHQVPAEWRGEGVGPGRFWGYRGLRQRTAGVDIEVDQWYRIRRAMRRWSERQAYYPPGSKYPARVEIRTRDVWVERGRQPEVDAVTGELRPRRRRKVRRRARYLDGRGGGFLLVNDGAAFASALAREKGPL